MVAAVYLECLKAAFLRLVIIKSSFKGTITNRIELSTPLNSWKRILEGVHLSNLGVDPYDGDLFHESPLCLRLFQLVILYFGPFIEYLFILIDIITACLLYKAAGKFAADLTLQEKKKKETSTFSEKSAHLLISKENADRTPEFVLFAFLYNPYIILNCVSFTTTSLANLCLASILYCMIYKYKFLCAILLSFAVLQSFYPILLILPICLVFYNEKRTRIPVVQIIVTFSISLTALIYLTYNITGSRSFVNSTFGFILQVHDLKPNIGLFWYFFTEMFEHFRVLFLSALQINATVLYLIPLGFNLKHEPIFLFMILLALTAIFKSYPSLGDVGFYLSLLPMWNHLFMFMQQRFFVACTLVITSVLGPTVWHLWIYSGSANANFYFGVTLAFATAQIFLLTDLLFAHKKREFALKNGWPYDASKTSLVLD